VPLSAINDLPRLADRGERAEWVVRDLFAELWVEEIKAEVKATRLDQ
jgi:hypothetical protein